MKKFGTKYGRLRNIADGDHGTKIMITKCFHTMFSIYAIIPALEFKASGQVNCETYGQKMQVRECSSGVADFFL